jgi:hypothetical protein
MKDDDDARSLALPDSLRHFFSHLREAFSALPASNEGPAHVFFGGAVRGRGFRLRSMSFLTFIRI